MATLKPNELRNLTKIELLDKMRTFHKELYALLYQNQTARVEKPHQMRILKRNIARCHTILGEKENAEPKR